MKNNTLKLVFALVGAVVTVSAIAVALIHFWDDIKKLFPGECKCNCEEEDFADIDAMEE